MCLNNNFDYIMNNGVNFIRFYVSDNILYSEDINSSYKMNSDIIHDKTLHYAVNTDIDGRIHIIIIDYFGRLIYAINDNEKWTKKKIEGSNFQSHNVMDLKLYIDPNNTLNINVILMLRDKKNNNLCSIRHYSIKKNSWSFRNINDFWTEKYDATIKTDIDFKGNIHLIYKTKDHNNYTLYYRKYLKAKNKWSYPEKICSNQDISNICMLCDSNNYINLIWSELQNKNIVIVHFKKNLFSSSIYGWEKSNSLSLNNFNFMNLAVVQYDSFLSLIWKHDNKFFQVNTRLKEDKWSDINILENFNNLKLAPVCYIGNTYKNYQLVKAPFTYYWANGNEIFLMGLDAGIPNSIDSNSIKEVKFPYSSFDEYMNSVEMYFQNRLDDPKFFYDFSHHPTDNINNSMEIPDLNMNEFKGKLIDLYYEIEELKTKELMLYNSLFKIRCQHISLYEKIEDILKDYEKLE